MGEPGPEVAVQILLRNQFHAELRSGSRPGWCVLAAKDGPLAKVLALASTEQKACHKGQTATNTMASATYFNGAESSFTLLTCPATRGGVFTYHSERLNTVFELKSHARTNTLAAHFAAPGVHFRQGSRLCAEPWAFARKLRSHKSAGLAGRVMYVGAPRRRHRKERAKELDLLPEERRRAKKCT